MNIIIERLYNDFFRPSKEAEYEKILACAKEAGYEFHTMFSFEDVIENGIDPSKKYIIMRRDIDTADHKILKKFLELEKKYDARATYYFRWNTINKKLMDEITRCGGNHLTTSKKLQHIVIGIEFVAKMNYCHILKK